MIIVIGRYSIKGMKLYTKIDLHNLYSLLTGLFIIYKHSLKLRGFKVSSHIMAHQRHESVKYLRLVQK